LPDFQSKDMSMAVPGRQVLLVAVSSALVVLCTVLLWTRPQPDLVKSLPATPAVHTRLQAFVFFRSADCSGNLAFARLFQRPRYRGAIHLTGVLLEGADEVAEASSQLRRMGVTMPILVAGKQLRQAIRPVAPGSGPLLVIVDRSSRLRMLMPTPRNPTETRHLAALLDGLAATEL
jgi:hypothetical protein